MKKTILLSSLFAVGAAIAAEVESGNAIGALNVEVTGAPAQQLIAVPFGAYGTGEAIAVKDMVKTGNLADGSKLYAANSTGAYNTWTLTDGKWVADKTVTIVQGVPSEGTAVGQENATVNRGDAVWIEPKFTTSGTSGTLYLLGEGDATAGSSSVTVGWNLVGNASTSVKTIAATGYKADERICVQKSNGSLQTYTYKTKVSGWVKQGEKTSSTVTIQPGQGFWFLSKGTTSIAW